MPQRNCSETKQLIAKTSNGTTSSKKMPEVRVRRIKLKQPDATGKDQVLTIAPSFVMPYMTDYTDEVADALFLRGFGVSRLGINAGFRA